MKAVAIVIDGHSISEFGFERLVESSFRVGNTFQIDRFSAITPSTLPKAINWNYPVEGEVIDLASGIKKKAYQGSLATRQACAMSHLTLWRRCAEGDEPFMILEHDAAFVNNADELVDIDLHYPIVGLNNPLKATRRAQVFYDEVIKLAPTRKLTVEAPWVDSDRLVPQGLAGNSAYIINPQGAEALIRLVGRFGMWPNDAIMCKQLLPNQLGVTTKFYTVVQNLQSTTTV